MISIYHKKSTPLEPKTELVKEEKLETVEQRANALYQEAFVEHAKRTDRLFAWIMIVQWVGAVLVAVIVTPKTWAGVESYVHPHQWYAVFFGALVTLGPLLAVKYISGTFFSRSVIAVAQMAMGILLIHLIGGRIETHFHVFASLAFLAFYRDWKVVIIATMIVAVDHLVRGIWFPFSVYGTLEPQPLRFLEHAFWVACEDVVLLIGCRDWLKDMRAAALRQADTALRQAELEKAASGIVAVIDSGSSLLAAATQLSSMAAEAGSAVNETTAMIVEARQTSEMSSQIASMVLDDSANIIQISQSGQSATAGTIAGMRRIRDQMESIIESMVKLKNQSKQIGEIIATADELAQQSNILAVNASIEAAKAGEHGQGFGVLAGEIRDLAQQSKSATGRARSILEGIAQAASEATSSAQRGALVVEEGENLARKAEEVIRVLSVNVDDAAKAATQIDKSNREQLLGMEQMITAISSVSKASEDSLQSVKELEAEAANLNDLAQQLKQLMHISVGNGMA